MKTLSKLLRTLPVLLAVAGTSAMPSAASAQNRPPEGGRSPWSQNKPSSPAVREEFRSSMKQFQGELDQLSKDVAGVSKKLETQSGASVDAGKAEVDALRERLIALGAQLQTDAPLSQNVDRFQSWISAQLGRVNGQRQSLGVEFVQRLISRYQEYQQEVSSEREKVTSGAKAIDSLLGELTMAELRISELLVAEDAGAAVTELRELVKNINRTIERIRQQIRMQVGTAGM
jgi:hypothetical protein